MKFEMGESEDQQDKRLALLDWSQGWEMELGEPDWVDEEETSHRGI